jgi:Fe2+-dicitrate sensor, membrane component
LTDDGKHIDYLIARYLNGEASPEERTVVEHWCAESEENQKYFDDLRLIFDHAAELETDTQFDVDAAWNRIAPQLSRSKRIDFRQRSWMMWASVAASVAILIGVWMGITRYETHDKAGKPIELAANNLPKKALLPDNSKVEVEPNSRIVYAEGFGKTNREVTLVGNASFDVHHQSGPSFTVRASGTFIKDIGTAFRVKTDGDTTIVEVYVKTGSVVFYTENNRGITLKQGETGIYNKITKEFTKIEPAKPENPPAVVKAFNFQETPLSEVIDLLQKAYNVRISLGNPKLGSCTITVRFENENIDTIIDIVAETLSLKVERQNKGYLLTGEECSK